MTNINMNMADHKPYVRGQITGNMIADVDAHLNYVINNWTKIATPVKKAKNYEMQCRRAFMSVICNYISRGDVFATKYLLDKFGKELSYTEYERLVAKSIGRKKAAIMRMLIHKCIENGHFQIYRYAAASCKERPDMVYDIINIIRDKTPDQFIVRSICNVLHYVFGFNNIADIQYYIIYYLKSCNLSQNDIKHLLQNVQWHNDYHIILDFIVDNTKLNLENTKIAMMSLSLYTGRSSDQVVNFIDRRLLI